MFKKRLWVLVIPAVLTGWAVGAQESRSKNQIVAQAAAPLEIATPEAFKAFIRQLIAGPDKKYEVVIQKNHGTFEKKGDSVIIIGPGEPPETKTLAEMAEMLEEMDLTECKSNLKMLAVASEMYATDNSGHYPQVVSKLAPNYLKVIMTCPSASSEPYSYTVSGAPDAYTFVCTGSHHAKAGVAPNFPQYNSYTGPAPGRDEKPEAPAKP